jgi:ribonuclease G
VIAAPADIEELVEETAFVEAVEDVPVLEEELQAPAAEPVPSAAPSARLEQDRDGDRDRRGRRGRRRRTRGKGFPESKYASDLQDAPPEESEPEVLSGREESGEEVFLLPGESLAKYRNRPSEPENEVFPDEADAGLEDSAPSIAAFADGPEPEQEPEQEPQQEAAPDAAEPVALQPDDPDAPTAQDVGPLNEVELTAAAAEETSVERERFEAGQIETPTEQSFEAAPESVASAFPDPAFFLSPVMASTTVDAEGESLSEESTDVASPESDASAGFDAFAIRDEAAESDLDPFVPGEEEPPIEEPPSEDEQPPIEEPGSEPPMQASVREQGNNKYQQRGNRRMRRRGRGGDRNGDRNGDRGPVADRGAAPVEAVAAVSERPERPERAERPERTDRTTERADRPERHQSRAPQGVEQQADDRRSPLPSITDLLKEGQEIIVQIAKEPLGQKGARITSHIALPGRYVVFMPTLEHLGVSRKIASDEERQRLKRILQTHREGITGGFIVRTAGESHTEDEIAADMMYLYNLWLDMRSKAEKKPAPVLLHHDLDIVQRILRDQLSDMYKNIWVDSEDVYESTVRFMQRFQPALVGRVKMYTRTATIFDAFGITTEIEKALRPKVWLKSGGYIVINQTEALVAIDVNTGKYVGKSNRLEDTITKTNTEAVKEIVRQIRLRDLGGIIVVDFIDMDERKNRQKVMQALEEAMRADRAPYKILQFNDFGLVAITRKRVKQSLERSLCAPCTTCEGSGFTKSVVTVVGEILQEAIKMRPNVDGMKNVVLRTHPEVAKFLKSNTNDFLEEIESVLKRSVMVKSDPLLHPEKFDFAL